MKKLVAAAVMAAFFIAVAPRPARADGSGVSLGISIAATVALGWFFISISSRDGYDGHERHREYERHDRYERHHEGHHDSSVPALHDSPVRSAFDSNDAREGRLDELVAVVYPVRIAY